ncbi:hypothetical protein T02_14856 [Trichinella nativa]|uniref:Uncharacterized protein n=1 Tax=Trichinella nativa TaxID=6335 RepID=A0A0V1LNU6_9BILA|nr:hypothetical protein T02_14856 [Trichinella nativa]
MMLLIFLTSYLYILCREQLLLEMDPQRNFCSEYEDRLETILIFKSSGSQTFLGCDPLSKRYAGTDNICVL